MGPMRHFKSYVSLRTTERKLHRIANDFQVTTFERYIADHGLMETS